VFPGHAAFAGSSSDALVRNDADKDPPRWRPENPSAQCARPPWPSAKPLPPA